VTLDLDRFRQLSGPVDLSGLDLAGAFRDRPLDAATLRCLRYMHDVEHHTVCYLRDLLLTPAHKDPDITAFLTFWAYEEHFHGEALGQVLAAHDEPAGAPRIASLRRRLGLADRLAPLTHLLGSALMGSSFIALHMTWGAVNEWTTQAGYARLSQRAGHPVLAELLQRIMRQEGHHIDVYAGQAADRLAHDARAQRVTRFALRHLWRPVGANVMPEPEVHFLIGHLFGGAKGEALAARIDRRIDRLPGLDGLHLIGRARQRPPRRSDAAPPTLFGGPAGSRSPILGSERAALA
jgi:hypothetical protein